MTDEPESVRIPDSDPAAIDLVFAIHGGDTGKVQQLLAERPELARAKFGGRGDGTRTALHMVADWPGYFPRGPEMVRILIAAGADPNVPTTGGGPGETPLQWAASSDDAAVAEALIDAGADLDTEGGSIGGPLANAIGYGCWHVARLLVARGAPIGSLWEAAALGDNHKVAELLSAEPPPDQAALNQAFWHACQGGQRRMAEYLLDRGADIGFSPEYANGMSVVEVVTLPATQQEALVEFLRGRGAQG
jgi:hypothetical protein